MHTHGIKVFDRTHNNAVVVFVTHNFHFEFFPANQALVNQQLTGWRQIETAGTDLNKLFLVIGNTTTRPTHRKTGADNGREANRIQNLQSLFHAMRDGRVRCF